MSTPLAINRLKSSIEELENISNDFTIHYSKSDWGFSIAVMESHGRSFGRMYAFDDDNKTIYLDMLSVNEDERGLGIGTEMQVLREEIGRVLKFTTVTLWVDKSTWMHGWYKRRGYSYFKEYKKQKNAVWMSKEIPPRVKDMSSIEFRELIEQQQEAESGVKKSQCDSCKFKPECRYRIENTGNLCSFYIKIETA